MLGHEAASVLRGVPTMKQAGLGDYVTETWIGLVAPKGTPDEIVRKLANVVEDAMQAPDLKRRYEVQGWQVVASSPEEFRSVIERDRITWSAIIHRSGLKLDQRRAQHTSNTSCAAAWPHVLRGSVPLPTFVR